jgi:hypothetical protein
MTRPLRPSQFIAPQSKTSKPHLAMQEGGRWEAATNALAIVVASGTALLNTKPSTAGGLEALEAYLRSDPGFGLQFLISPPMGWSGDRIGWLTSLHRDRLGVLERKRQCSR